MITEGGCRLSECNWNKDEQALRVYDDFQRAKSDTSGPGIAMHAQYLTYSTPNLDFDTGLFDAPAYGGAARRIHTDAAIGWSKRPNYGSGE